VLRLFIRSSPNEASVSMASLWDLLPASLWSAQANVAPALEAPSLPLLHELTPRNPSTNPAIVPPGDDLDAYRA
jgi:hypothetical protein